MPKHRRWKLRVKKEKKIYEPRNLVGQRGKTFRTYKRKRGSGDHLMRKMQVGFKVVLGGRLLAGVIDKQSS